MFHNIDSLFTLHRLRNFDGERKATQTHRKLTPLSSGLSICLSLSPCLRSSSEMSHVIIWALDRCVFFTVVYVDSKFEFEHVDTLHNNSTITYQLVHAFLLHSCTTLRWPRSLFNQNQFIK